jgi:hypothetical protein
VARRTFGYKWEDVRGGLRKLYNLEFHNLLSSKSIIKVIKTKRMKYVGHVTCMAKMRKHTKF